MATLGCANTYQAVIHDLGGRRRFFTLNGIASVDWERRLDDFGEAHVELTKARASRDCYRRLGDIEPWDHELTLYRDGQRIWEGPVFDVEEDRTSVVITARDMLAWLARRALHSEPSPLLWPPAAYAAKVITDALGVDGQDPNLVQHIKIVGSRGRFPTLLRWRETQPRTTNALAEVQEIVKAGLDLFVLGRSIHIAHDAVDWAKTRMHHLREQHFLGDFKVRKVGAETASRAFVAGVPPQGSPEGTPAPIGVRDGRLPGRPLVENVSSSSNTSDLAVLNGLAARVVGYGNPTPIVVTLPANSQLSPNAPMTVDDLIPGRFLKIVIASYANQLRTIQKLQQIAGTWAPGKGERITVSLIPKDTTDLPEPQRPAVADLEETPT